MPYRYVSQIPHACAHACIRMCVFVCAQVNLSVLEYVKIYHRNGKHPSMAIFDKHLVGQTNQGLPTILEQYPLEIVLTVT